MNGVNFLVDTNVCLYLLSGNKTIAEILDGNNLFISFITQLELLSFNNLTDDEKSTIHSFIDDCIVIDLNEDIKEFVVILRSKHKIKLPDSIIAATSVYFDIPFITADKGFKKIEELNLLFYQV
jgi:predicted nucleic acid-binding protein